PTRVSGPTGESVTVCLTPMPRAYAPVVRGAGGRGRARAEQLDHVVAALGRAGVRDRVRVQAARAGDGVAGGEPAGDNDPVRIRDADAADRPAMQDIERAAGTLFAAI